MDSNGPRVDLNSNITGVTRLLMAQRGGMTQTDLADALGVAKAVISRSFNGARPWKIDDVEALARYFDVSPALFFDDPDTLIRNRWFSPLVATLSDISAA